MNYHSNLKRSQQQEKLAAQTYGGKVQPCSGARAHSKGDVTTPVLLIEAKTTNTEGYRVTVGNWLKIQREAALEGKTGVMLLELSGHRMFVVPECVVESYTQKEVQ